MQIIWHGQSFFEIAIKSTNNVETKIAIDPYGENIGLKLYKIAADILLISHQHSDHNNAKAIIMPMWIEGMTKMPEPFQTEIPEVTE